MPWKPARLTVIVLTPLLLMACGVSGPRPEIRLAEVPADIRRCFDDLVARPPGKGAMSSREVVSLIGRLRLSEEAKSDCGKRLIALYDAQAEALAKAEGE